MKWLKTYKVFESQSGITDDVNEIMLELEDKGYKIEITYWINGNRGLLRSDELGKYLNVEVEKIEPSGNFITKDGFNWEDTKPYFDRLRTFLEHHSDVKYKINTMLFSHVPRFSVFSKSESTDRYQTSFDYIDVKYLEEGFTEANTLTSVSYFFERL
jgi:hypothetical protein